MRVVWLGERGLGFRDVMRDAGLCDGGGECIGGSRDPVGRGKGQSAGGMSL